MNSPLLLRTEDLGIQWEAGNGLPVRKQLADPAPSLNELTTFLGFFPFLSTFPSNILSEQEPKILQKVSHGKTIQSLFGSCVQPVTISRTFWSVLKRNAWDVKFQRKTLAPNQAVSYDKAPPNTKKKSPFNPRGTPHVPGENLLHVISAAFTFTSSFLPLWSLMHAVCCDFLIDWNLAGEF